MTPQTFIFAGASGCGKGTQVELLKQYLAKKTPDIEQFCSYTGDGFRALIEGTTVASRRAREIQMAGGLQPEFLAVWLWADLLIKNFNGDEHLFIDGSPRKLGEAIVLDSALEFFKRERIHVIVIEISDEETTRRLLARGRADDTVEAIRKRLGWYRKSVVPAMDYFKMRRGYEFVEINGEQTPEAVHQDILQVLKF
ncbi:MAG: nucleoside monophosphate kinase [Candidatus Taylorbacteria bacterium]|nr:nucleoside monophosphate kinase [Candidatus Taylorbacteria bacterium]